MLPRKLCEYKEFNKCSAVVPHCVCGRDAAKKVRDAENKVKKLKKEVDELKKQPDAAAQMGGEISKWATTWLHDNAVTSPSLTPPPPPSITGRYYTGLVLYY